MSTEGPVVSRIVTCYGQWDFIKLWLDEDNLFVPEVEWLLMDDKPSEPPPAELLQRLKQRGIHYHKSDFNLGRSAQRNKGAALAAGSTAMTPRCLWTRPRCKPLALR